MKIKAENVSYTYNVKQPGEFAALHHISTTIEDGEFVAIIGHTGSGKSTFIQCLNALLIPTDGKVIVEEYTIQNKVKLKNIKELRKKIGIVFQFPEYQLFEETVEKDILFGPKNFNLQMDDPRLLASAVLKTVGLDDSFLDKSPFELSGGEKRRVAIAGILAFEPDVLIVDEPTAGLDPQAADKMMELFKKLNQNGKTIILVTHQMEHVLSYANRVLAINHGQLVADTTPMKLFLNETWVKELEVDIPDIIYLSNLMVKKYPEMKKYEIKNIADFVAAYKAVKKL